MVRMSSSALARLLETTVPGIESPRRELEQYTTPADIAVRIAVHAKLSGALEGAVVADLGAGTCRLVLPMIVMGARLGVAVDADPRLWRYCRRAAEALGVSDRLVYVASRLSGKLGPLWGLIDLAVTNPPFGVWRRGADWEVLSHAMEAGVPRIYAILKSGNMHYHEARAREWGYSARLLWTEDFPIPASMPGHRSRVYRVRADVVLFERGLEGQRL
jgi:putative methylase